MNLGRCFVGIPLAPNVVDSLVRASETVAREDPRWAGEKWVRAENLHITLAFIGRVADEELPSMLHGLDAALAGVRRFDLRLHAVTAIPDERHTKMLWASLEDRQGNCAALASRVAEVTCPSAEEGRRTFRPHITLARSRRTHPTSRHALEEATRQLLQSSDAQNVSVLAATLFASTLGPSGPLYEEIRRWEFCR